MKTIMIDDETYKKLKNMKGDKSFSKLLSFLAENAKHGSKDILCKFYGILTEEEAEIWDKAIMESRNNLRERV
ncbi:MAG: antitoxin VapB family protein [Thermoplasmata archaeon]